MPSWHSTTASTLGEGGTVGLVDKRMQVCSAPRSRPFTASTGDPKISRSVHPPMAGFPTVHLWSSAAGFRVVIRIRRTSVAAFSGGCCRSGYGCSWGKVNPREKRRSVSQQVSMGPHGIARSWKPSSGCLALAFRYATAPAPKFNSQSSTRR